MATTQVSFPPLDLKKIAGKTRKLKPSEDVLSDVTPVDWGFEVFDDEDEKECVKSET